MKTATALTAAALIALAGAATAGGHTAEIRTPSGKTVWSLGDALPGGGVNNGGKGKTDRAAGGLTTAAGAGALSVVDVTPGN